MKLSAEGRERLRQASPIEVVVKECGVALKRVGKGLMGLCPFHEDHKPSLSVQLEQGRFRCFGCGEGGDVFRFVEKSDGVDFVEAAKRLASRAGLHFEDLCENGAKHSGTPRQPAAPPAAQPARRPRPDPAPVRVLAAVATPAPASVATPAPTAATPAAVASAGSVSPAALLSRVVDHYHRTLLERPEAQEYLARKRGLSDVALWKAFRIGYADGSLSKVLAGDGELRAQLAELGVLRADGGEFFGGCIVVPIPDPGTGAWVSAYGRSTRVKRHLYLKGPLRGVLNYQAIKAGGEVVLTESVLDALSFHQTGIAAAVPLYGANGFTSDHLDALLKGSRRVVLCLDNDGAGKQASATLAARLDAAGIAVRVAELPAGVKDPNDLLLSKNGDAADTFARLLSAAVCRGQASPSSAAAVIDERSSPVSAPSPVATPMPAPGPAPAPAPTLAPSSPENLSPPALATPAPSAASTRAGEVMAASAEALSVRFPRRVYHAKAFTLDLQDRLRCVLRAESTEHVSEPGQRFLVDALDLYAARSRKEYARRAAAKLGHDEAGIEDELLALLGHLERHRDELRQAQDQPQAQPVAMTEEERAEALSFLKRPDLLDLVAADVDALGFVGESTNTRLLYLVAISRKLGSPLSAVILSQSGAGKSGITEVIELMTAPEDVVLITRLTPQSLYYTPPGFLDRKLVIIEERYGSTEADYSIRVLQSRGRLIAAAPVKDPHTGNLRTRTFEVSARAAFVEATTASSVNHENATRCFELSMDESVEQTARIHARQRLSKTEAGLKLRAQQQQLQARHWNAQRLLEPLSVVIPYADAVEFPVSWMRTRRDHARFLNLIEVSAFLHQYQRGRSEAGHVIASVEDYAVAYALASEVLSETLCDLKKPLRDFLAELQAVVTKKVEAGDDPAKVTFTRKEVRLCTAHPDHAVKRHLADLEELEYVSALSSGKGRTCVYRLLEGPETRRQVTGLLSPAELALRLGQPVCTTGRALGQQLDKGLSTNSGIEA